MKIFASLAIVLGGIFASACLLDWMKGIVVSVIPSLADNNVASVMIAWGIFFVVALILSAVIDRCKGKSVSDDCE